MKVVVDAVKASYALVTLDAKSMTKIFLSPTPHIVPNAFQSLYIAKKQEM